MEDILSFFPQERKIEDYIASSPSEAALKERLTALLPIRASRSFRVVEFPSASRKDGLLISRAIRNVGGLPPPPELTLEHCHEYVELVFVLSGSMTQAVNGVEAPLTQGQVCVLNMNTSHYERDVGPGDTVIFLGLLPQTFKRYCGIAAENGRPVIPASFWGDGKESLIMTPRPGDSARITACTYDLLYRICEETYGRRPGFGYLAQGLTVRLIHHLFHSYDTQLMSTPAAERSAELCREIIRFMRGHLREVNRELVASTFNFAPGYINFLIKRVTGKTFTKELRDLRMERAEQLLAGTDMCVGEIIEAVGYSNKNHFYRLFQEKYGVTPCALRKKSRYGSDRAAAAVSGVDSIRQ